MHDCHSKTKIICTLGPSSSSVENLVELCRSGMNIARLNMSHGDYDDKTMVIENIKKAEKITGQHIPVMLDLCGPKMRLGVIKKPFSIARGDRVVITTEETDGGDSRVSTTYKNLHIDVKKGNTILINDGLIKLEVESVKDNDVTCITVDGGIMQSKKGINLPDVKISIPVITEKDKEDIDYGIKNRVDFFAMSFVRSSSDIRDLKSIILRKSARIPVIAKIERPEAIEDIDSICSESDAVMIARGDLGVEMNTEEVPLLQKLIIEKCIERNRPVITATQMLESMINSPRPTRAEASDVANAVFDGTDAVMLSGETSVGNFPVEAVKIMHKICLKAEEQSVSRDRSLRRSRNEDITHDFLVKNMTRSVCSFAGDINASAIIVLTRTGKTARRLSRLRNRIPIIAFVEKEETIRHLSLVWGVKAELIDNLSDTDSTLDRAKELAFNLGYIKKGERVVFTAGIPLLESNQANMMKFETV